MLCGAQCVLDVCDVLGLLTRRQAMSMLRMIRANPPPIPSNAPYSLTGWNPAPPALDTNGFRSGFTCSAYQVRPLDMPRV